MKTLLCFSILLRATSADITWPLYNQQCQDDAGPPFLDDEPGVKYHDTNSAAYPILQNGVCPKPLEYACSVRPDPKTAYLEGPIDCGDKGWYCRIMPDEIWPPVTLLSDVNFGHCNTTVGIDDAGFDQDGHCHGSSKDNTYYWWIRDHWHRQYNGRVRCCCGWFEPAPGSNGANTALYDRRIANRCDYRRQLLESEDPAECRDANEDHGMGFDDIGCDPQTTTGQIGSPIPESDDYCWEIAQFGFAENIDAPSSVTLSPAAPPFASSAPISNTATPNVQPSSAPASNDVPAPTPNVQPSSPPVPAPSDDDASDSDECEDSPLEFKWNKKKTRDCEWVATNPEKRCKKVKVKSHCPLACIGKSGQSFCNKDSKAIFYDDGSEKFRKCKWVKKNPQMRCRLPEMCNTCRATCDGVEGCT